MGEIKFISLVNGIEQRIDCLYQFINFILITVFIIISSKAIAIPFDSQEFFPVLSKI